MIRALLVDDEAAARRVLNRYLGRHCPEVEVLGEADSVESGKAAIEKLQPNLVFLDILMGDGSGFELLDQVHDRSFHVVFTTSYDNFAIKAFRYNAADYLLKVIDPKELVKAVERIKQLPAPSAAPRYSELQKAFRSKTLDKITLPVATGYKILRLEDIVRCQSDNTYTTFFTANGDRVVVSRSIKSFEEILPEDKFFRIHQSHLINLDHVTEYLKSEGGFVVMSDGEELAVSKRKKEQFLSLFLYQ